jgi:hypothetical protein
MNLYETYLLKQTTHTILDTHTHKQCINLLETYLLIQTTQLATTLSFVLGAVSEDFLESAFLFFSGLGFIPSIIGTITQTLGTVLMLITSNIENIKAALSTVRAFFVGVFAGALGAMTMSRGSVVGGGAVTATKSGASKSANIAKEHTDAGKVSDAKNAHKEEQEGISTWKGRVRAVFDSIDSERAGVLHLEVFGDAKRRRKIQSVFFSNDVLMSKAMFNRFFAEMDANHNGVIDFEEFAAAVRKTDPRWHGDEDDANFTEHSCKGGSTRSESSATATRKVTWRRFSFKRSNAVRDAKVEASMPQINCAENAENTNAEALYAPVINIHNSSCRTSPRLSAVSSSSDITVLARSDPPPLPGWLMGTEGVERSSSDPPPLPACSSPDPPPLPGCSSPDPPPLPGGYDDLRPKSRQFGS